MVWLPQDYNGTYKEVYPVGSTTLKSGKHVYEAQKDMPCAFCETIIPVNSLFSCARWYPPSKRAGDRQWFLPACRMCKPFRVCKFINGKNPVMRDREMEWVDEDEEEAAKRRTELTWEVNPVLKTESIDYWNTHVRG